MIFIIDPALTLSGSVAIGNSPLFSAMTSDGTPTIKLFLPWHRSQPSPSAQPMDHSPRSAAAHFPPDFSREPSPLIPAANFCTQPSPVPSWEHRPPSLPTPSTRLLARLLPFRARRLRRGRIQSLRP